MKILQFIALIFSLMPAFAEVQLLPYGSKSFFSAQMPCIGQLTKINSGIGITTAIQCGKSDSRSACTFLLSEQKLDEQAFAKFGYEFIGEIHKNYAKQMDANYKTIEQNVVQYGGLGTVLKYELIRMQEGTSVNVKGLWAVSEGKLIRGTVSCVPHGTTYLKQERELFMRSLATLQSN